MGHSASSSLQDRHKGTFEGVKWSECCSTFTSTCVRFTNIFWYRGALVRSWFKRTMEGRKRTGAAQGKCTALHRRRRGDETS